MKTTPLNALLACLLVAPLVQAASPPAAPDDQPPLEQVVIEATRANLVKLGKQALMTEYRYFQRYNELNTKREFAVNCANEASVGSRFTHSQCQPVFKTEAETAEVQELVFSIQRAVLPPGNGESPTIISGTSPASVAIEASRPGFKKNMIEVTRRSPDLVKLLEEHAALVKRYEDTYRILNGRKPVPEGQGATNIPRQR